MFDGAIIDGSLLLRDGVGSREWVSISRERESHRAAGGSWCGARCARRRRARARRAADARRGTRRSGARGSARARRRGPSARSTPAAPRAAGAPRPSADPDASRYINISSLRISRVRY